MSYKQEDKAFRGGIFVIAAFICVSIFSIFDYIDRYNLNLELCAGEVYMQQETRLSGLHCVVLVDEVYSHADNKFVKQTYDLICSPHWCVAEHYCVMYQRGDIK